MAYRLNPKESVSDGIRRIVHEELSSAAEGLRGNSGGKRDESIHEARKSIKKVRAVLRLARGPLGAVSRAGNIRLRNLGRRLSNLRDAGAMLEILDSLKRRFEAAISDQTLESVRRGLLARKDEAEDRAGERVVIERVADALDRFARSAKAWPAPPDGFGSLEAGLKRTIRNARKAMALVEKDPSDANYHEWRKRAKDHWYHVRLLGDLSRGPMKRRERDLDELSECLGDDHNLVVLREKLLAEPRRYGAGRDVEAFLALITDRQAELRKNALAAGAALYDAKPRKLIKQMEQSWAAARRRSKSATPKTAKPKRRRAAAVNAAH